MIEFNRQNRNLQRNKHNIILSNYHSELYRSINTSSTLFASSVYQDTNVVLTKVIFSNYPYY